jgi:hypothetical protein
VPTKEKYAPFVICSVFVCCMQHSFIFYLKALWKNLKVADTSGGGGEMLPCGRCNHAFRRSPTAKGPSPLPLWH